MWYASQMTTSKSTPISGEDDYEKLVLVVFLN